jgi:16S rRNA (cytosine1402-N4)-methyltransferase
MKNQHQNKHQPVLIDEVVRVLSPRAGESYLDGTAGFGGHAQAIVDQIGPSAQVTLVDRDSNAVAYLATKFQDQAEILHMSYAEAAEQLLEQGNRFDMILLDLGVSSPQLDNPERGFSFQNDAPLDMRMDQSQALTAEHMINTYPHNELERILREYGEEHRARSIVAAIIAARPVKTTRQLADIVRRAIGSSGKINPATKTFQAIRIAVNSELTQLEEALPFLTKILTPGGRLAVISFHSLEDRIVKQFFDHESRDCVCPPKQPICTCNHQASMRKLTPKAITGDSTEIVSNPRARSAKLRAAEKLKPKK